MQFSQTKPRGAIKRFGTQEKTVCAALRSVRLLSEVRFKTIIPPKGAKLPFLEISNLIHVEKAANR